MKVQRILVGVLALGLLFALTMGLSLAQEAELQDGLAPQGAMGTAFTYQGRLIQNGVPVTDTCDFRFTLYDAAGDGGQIGSAQTKTGKQVSDGYFTVKDLDFGGSAFDGEARWLGVEVKCTGDDDYTDMGRQPLTPAPYALALPGLRTQQNSTSPNLIGGYSDNAASGTGGVVGANIGGGGQEGSINQVTDDFGTIGGGADNQAGDDAGSTSDAHYATVGGGYGNDALDSYATVSGGRGNEASGLDTSVGGGRDNTASGYAATVGGGQSNETGSSYATIGGGLNNEANGSYGAVGGGGYNTASGIGAVVAGGGGLDTLTPVTNTASGDWSAVGGGAYNAASDYYATVGGGYGNRASGYGATIGGGGGLVELETYTNTASGTLSTVGGGGGHVASGDWSAISGGAHNSASNGYATVGGGYDNEASGRYATIPGGESAAATLYGQMAYASGDFASKGDAQTSLYVLRNATSDETETELFLDGALRRLTIASDTSVIFDIQVLGYDSFGNSGGYHFEGVIDNLMGTTNMVASTKTVLDEEITDWDVVIEADDDNDALVIKVTGLPSNLVRWVATVRTTEVSW